MWTCHRTLGRGGCLSRMFRQTVKYCRKVQEWKKIDNIPFIYLIFVYIPAWEGIYVRRRLKMRVRSQIALRRRRNVGQAIPTERKDATTGPEMRKHNGPVAWKCDTAVPTKSVWSRCSKVRHQHGPASPFRGTEAGTVPQPDNMAPCWPTSWGTSVSQLNHARPTYVLMHMCIQIIMLLACGFANAICAYVRICTYND